MNLEELFVEARRAFDRFDGSQEALAGYIGVDRSAVSQAIRNAGSLNGPAIRQGYFDIAGHEGLIKTYDNPFSADSHDALGPDDYLFTQFKDGQILPIQ